MKILILANLDVGLYQFRKELIKELLKDNEVYISLPYGELINPLEKMGAKFINTPVDRRGINPVTDLRLYKKYLSIMKDIKPDLVITYTIKPNIYGGMAAQKLHIKYATNITGLGTAFQKEGLIKLIAKTMYKKALKKAKVVFFENDTNRKYFIREGIAKSHRTCLLAGAGVNLDKYKEMEYPDETDKTTFLFMGRVMAEKGILELLEVMERLKEDKENAELIILGEMEDNLKDKIREYETKADIKYIGYVKDVKPYIQRCHCFVLPSWHEGMANTNLESAACARPIITTNIPGCREAVIDQKSGYLVEKQNPDDLYDKMKNFITKTKEERIQMGKAGRQHMEQHFNRNLVITETISQL